MLSKLDLPLLEVLCSEWDVYRRACEFIETHGDWFIRTDAKGRVIRVREFPAVSIRRKAIAQITRLGDELGLSPASRSRILAFGKMDQRQEQALRLLG